MKYTYTLYTFLYLLICGSISAQTNAESVLSDGAIYKIAIPKDGVYKLTHQFLSDAGLDLTKIDPKKIAIYGNGGGMLPSEITTTRVDDLIENAIEVVGEEDGRFDTGDYILLYAQGADETYYDTNMQMWRTAKNRYDTQNYYFLKIQTTNGKRIPKRASLSEADYQTDTYDAVIHFEEDKVNLLEQFVSTQGSGSAWYGDEFGGIDQHNYNFQFDNLVPNQFIQIQSELVARHSQVSRFNIQANGRTMESSNISSGRSSFISPTEQTYAYEGVLRDSFSTATNQIDLSVRYSGEYAWLDYITLNARCMLAMNNKPLLFSDVQAWKHRRAAYVVSGLNTGRIWNITRATAAEAQVHDNGAFVADSTAKVFIAFEDAQAQLPSSIVPLPNQNIHALARSEMIILFHERFTEQAVRLMEHRQDYSNLLVDTVRIDKLYNEFSSGRQDPTAIRDFARWLRDRSPDFKYLLLFGDGSFDYRNIKGISEEHHFIPVYETPYSLSPIRSYPSDDYYALLEEGEELKTKGDLDIAVGRLPVKSVEEARQVVDKIITYETAPESFGDWRNRLIFVADDEDGNGHFNQTNNLARRSKEDFGVFNQDKIYFDAFPQVSTSGGEGFPLATEALNQSIFRGALAINYLGHGGPKGWAQERVLDRDRGDIRGWSNYHRMPVFITATCSFTGYDDPNQVTAGEEVLLNPNGGGIALLTTVRAVYSSSNEKLVNAVFDTMFYFVDGKRPMLGDVMRIAKNKIAQNAGTSTVENTRKFALIGDPALQLALPKYNIVTTAINGKTVTSTSIDTLGAFQEVTVSGEIHDQAGQLFTPFNGEIIPTIFDKAVTYATLGQDRGSQVANFQLRTSVLFKGRAQVQDGKFEFTFVMPKDINFTFGAGRISYYAQDTTSMLDARGIYEKIIIGGTDTVLNDEEGPLVEVFMNTTDFVAGGITDENPVLLVRLSDDNGINVSGNSIGHDLEAVLDDDTQNTYLLNEFYESELNDYRRGTVRFPLVGLAEGLHRIRVKAWDIANNSSEGYTEFMVITSERAVLKNLLAFPNPFVDATCIQFEHNLGEQELDIQVNIHGLDGRLVKTLKKRIFAQGFITDADDCVTWDGTNQAGQIAPAGMYLYQVQLSNTSDPTKTTNSEFRKLIFLR
ncbi:MAG: type IX secretion system sortase PorU [Bacteroidota bacterium]